MKLSEQERAADRMADAIADGLVEIGQRIGGCDRIAFMYADGSIERSSGGLCVDALHAECRRIARASISALTPEPAPVEEYKSPCGWMPNNLSQKEGVCGCTGRETRGMICRIHGCALWRSTPAPVEYRDLTPDELRALVGVRVMLASGAGAGILRDWDRGTGCLYVLSGKVSAATLRKEWLYMDAGPGHAAGDPVAARIGGAK